MVTQDPNEELEVEETFENEDDELLQELDFSDDSIILDE